MSHDVRLLRSFVVLAEELHFGRAAARLHITQPALSQQIQRLERQLGLTLLHRSGRAVSLSEGGAAILAPAHAALDAARAVQETAAGVRGGHYGEVALGFSPGAHLAVQTLLRRFGQARPAVRVRALQASSRALAEQVADGRLDLALGFCTGPGPGYETEVLAEEPAVLAVADTHPLAGSTPVTLADLAAEAFALVDARDGPGYNAAVLRLCREAGFEPRASGAAEGPMAWEAAVRAGRRVGLTTRSTARSSAGGIALVPLRPAPAFAIELVRPAGEPGPARPAAEALAATARALGAARELASGD